MENWRRLAPNWRKTPQSIIGADWRGKFYAYLLFYRNMIFHPSVRYKNWLQLALIHQKKTVKNSHKLAQIGVDWHKRVKYWRRIGAGKSRKSVFGGPNSAANQAAVRKGGVAGKIGIYCGGKFLQNGPCIGAEI